MATNELIIGLGGVGGRSIAAFRRTMEIHEADKTMLADRGYRFEYLYIDSDADVLNSASWKYAGRSYALNPSDYILLKDNLGDNPSLDRISDQKNIKNWIGTDFTGQYRKRRGMGETGRALLNMDGAGQLRRLGRALFAMNTDKISKNLAKKIYALKEGSPSPDINIRIFCTLGGGTGSGSLIDMIAMLHSTGIDGEKKVFVYPFIAGAAAAAANTGSFYENEYATLRDLNALIVKKYGPDIVDVHGTPGDTFRPAGTPVNAVYLSSEISPGSPDLDKQITYMAEACFDTIVYSNSYTSVNALRALSGQDLVQITQGESVDDNTPPERSYRFAALGGKKWCVPTALIRKLLVSEQKMRIFSAHLSGSGGGSFKRDYSKLSLPRGLQGRGTDEALKRICEEIEEPVKKYKDDADKNAEKEGNTLSRIREEAAKIIGTTLGMSSLPQIRREFATLYQRDVAAMMDVVHTESDRVLQWTGAAAETWGIKDLDDCLQEYKTDVVGWADGAYSLLNDDDLNKKTDQLLNNMQAREAQWEKIGVMTQLLTAKGATMVRDQIEDALSLVRLHLRRFQHDIVSGLTDAYSIELGAFKERIVQLCKDLESCKATELASMASIENELTTPGGGVGNLISDMYEFDPENLRQLREQIGKEGQLFAEQMAGCFQVHWNQQIGELRNYTRRCLDAYREHMAGDVFGKVCELDELARGHRGGLRNVLVSSIIEYLRDQGGNNVEDWEERLGHKVQKFVRHMRCSSTLQGTGLTRPQVAPAKAFVIGFPEDQAEDPQLVAWLKKKIEQSIPTDLQPLPGRLDFYTHQTPDEIRLLYLPYWLPARFAPVVDVIYEEYKRTAKDVNADKTKIYFANIDNNDYGLDSAVRPPLTLDGLPDKEMRFKVELARSLFVHNSDVLDGEEQKVPLISDDTQDQSGRVHVLRDLSMGVATYDKFNKAEIAYPGDAFQSAIANALRMAMRSMSEEEKTAVLNQYRRKYQELVDPNGDFRYSPADPEPQEAANKLQKVAGFFKQYT